MNRKLGLAPALNRWHSGFVEKRLEVDPELCHGSVLFGGYIAAIADQVLGLTAMTVLPDRHYFGTTHMSISYLAPVTAGVLKIQGIVIRQQRSSIHVESTFYLEGDVVAKATATQVVYPQEHF